MFMTDKTSQYGLTVFLLWGVVIAITAVTINNVFGITGRKALFLPVVAIGIYVLLVNRISGGQRKDGENISRAKETDLWPGHSQPSGQPIPSRQFLTDAEKREWLDKFLLDMQNK